MSKVKSLSQYKKREIKLLRLFKMEWMAQREKNKRDWPTKMPSADWDEQYICWKEDYLAKEAAKIKPRKKVA